MPDENPEILGGGGTNNPGAGGGENNGGGAAFDWQAQLPEAVRTSNAEALKGFTNDATGLQKLFTDYGERGKLIGQKGLTALPENATDEQKKAWDADFRKVMGVPADAKGYTFDADTDQRKHNPELRASFTEVAHKLGIPPSMVKGLDAWSHEFAAAQQQKTNEAFDTAAKSRFGDTADAKVKEAQTLIAANISPQFKDLVGQLDNNALLVLADVVLAQQGKLGGEDKPTNAAGQAGGGGKSADELHQEKLTLMSSKAYTDPFDPQHEATKKKVLDLNEQVYKLRNPAK